MAVIVNPNEIRNITEYPNSFKRQGNFPLDISSIYENYASAYAYASSNISGAYVGQILIIKSDNRYENKLTVNFIEDENGTLTKLATGDDTPSSIINLFTNNYDIDDHDEYLTNTTDAPSVKFTQQAIDYLVDSLNNSLTNLINNGIPLAEEASF